jgi:hypothetical protein
MKYRNRGADLLMGLKIPDEGFTDTIKLREIESLDLDGSHFRYTSPM